MTRHTSLLTTLAHRSLGATLTASLVLAPLPVFASAPAEEDASADEAAPAEAATVGGNVAVLKFEGDGDVDGWRAKVQGSLEYQGYVANLIKRSLTEAADKNKCKTTNADCLGKIGAYLNKNSKVAYDFFAFAEVPAAGTGKIVIFDIAANAVAVELTLAVTEGDYILPEVLAPAAATRLAHYQAPPAPITEAEQAHIAALDEPEKTPEEIEAEKRRIAEAEAGAVSSFKQGLDVGAQVVDLRTDFDEFCREGDREDKEIQNPDGTVTKERDLRPKCSRGPVFGYWQPRSWVALTLTLGSAVTMGIMYGMAAGARGQWKDAKDTLAASGLSSSDPNAACEGDTCYADLAGAVSEAGSKVRRRAIIGDVMLGSTVLLAGVLAIIIYQDRTAAKAFIGREKELRALGNLRVGPMIGESNGASVGFDF
ncbi:hypothetical protein G6O69_25780 [Pseudenhygromyxa sp. WMMC2535]|uniref:hypothetical protein n=1 Tax=Pseudenhygromyxa sp. WMMC2535 TaxID=2712867 RepID=UPI0015576023|nr:hypothetical protein [Pseudenhygromyxa sp. WMMC2535]NVB41276.1 hypothetical protein [Pseudenhygromyxa sp. WMMC2535]